MPIKILVDKKDTIVARRVLRAISNKAGNGLEGFITFCSSLSGNTYAVLAGGFIGLLWAAL